MPAAENAALAHSCVMWWALYLYHAGRHGHPCWFLYSGLPLILRDHQRSNTLNWLSVFRHVLIHDHGNGLPVHVSFLVLDCIAGLTTSWAYTCVGCFFHCLTWYVFDGLWDVYVWDP